DGVLAYTGDATITISGTGSAEFGLDVLITGNPNSKTQKQRELVYISGGKANLILENLTIQNTDTNDQSEAIATDGTGNLAAYNCSFLSHQDTIRTVGKAWFYKCYVEGDVDFLWMESSGKVALYESCVLRAVNDRTDKAYFAAPRMSPASKVNKGLVIYNSTLEAEDMTVYLGRNVWPGTEEYKNVAVIGSTFYGTLHDDVWYRDADGTSDQQYVGFKTDSYFKKSSNNYGTVLTPAAVSAEYGGRTNIMNRVYDTIAQRFKPEQETTRWDINKLAADRSWNVVTDTSKHLLDGETETVTKSYDLSGETLPTELTISSFSHHSSGSATGGNGSTITVPLTGKAVVTVTGIYSGNGTIKAGEQGEAVYDFGTGSTSKTAEKGYVVYDASATSVVITATSSTYITKIEVEYDSTLTFTPVTAIAVSGDSATYTVGVPLALSAAVTPGNATNHDVKWSSSDESVGKIDEYSGIVTFAQAGKVTFTATARDRSGATGTIACEPKAATWTSAEWYDSKDASSTTTSGSGTGLGGSAGENNSVFSLGTGVGGVTLGGAKSVQGVGGKALSLSVGLKMNSSGTVTFSVTKNATVLVKTGYCSDSNATTDTLKITASNEGTATADSKNPTTAPTADTDYKWTLTPGTYTIERAGSGYAPSIYYVRVDITE
ncbi:MAG: Ig-like domain-containing protein, partial [Treponemataceae bacterium]|nr:Ig-like domain-containing protein [Treponemataceae bacterium]